MSGPVDGPVDGPADGEVVGTIDLTPVGVKDDPARVNAAMEKLDRVNAQFPAMTEELARTLRRLLPYVCDEVDDLKDDAEGLLEEAQALVDERREVYDEFLRAVCGRP